ncbi:MAG: 50S ribosomal protein L18 [bacterium]
MNKLKNKLLDKKRKYFRRKIRTNKIAKTVSNFPRVIINRSNKFIYAQVIDSEGKVIVSINDYSLK